MIYQLISTYYNLQLCNYIIDEINYVFTFEFAIGIAGLCKLQVYVNCKPSRFTCIPDILLLCYNLKDIREKGQKGVRACTMRLLNLETRQTWESGDLHSKSADFECKRIAGAVLWRSNSWISG